MCKCVLCTVTSILTPGRLVVNIELVGNRLWSSTNHATQGTLDVIGHVLGAFWCTKTLVGMNIDVRVGEKSLCVRGTYCTVVKPEQSPLSF